MPTMGAAQLLQAPEHALAQQTPSAQNPDVHWLFAAQGIARPSLGTHVGATQ
jgi:hypothetical protein